MISLPHFCISHPNLDPSPAGLLWLPLPSAMTIHKSVLRTKEIAKETGEPASAPRPLIPRPFFGGYYEGGRGGYLVGFPRSSISSPRLLSSFFLLTGSEFLPTSLATSSSATSNPVCPCPSGSQEVQDRWAAPLVREVVPDLESAFALPASFHAYTRRIFRWPFRWGQHLKSVLPHLVKYRHHPRTALGVRLEFDFFVFLLDHLCIRPY